MSSSAGNKRLTCPFKVCTSKFARNSDLNRHIKQVHNPDRHTCKVPGCTFYGTNRPSKLTSHTKEQHPELVGVPLAVPEDFGTCKNTELGVDAQGHGEFSERSYPLGATYGNLIQLSTNFTTSRMIDGGQQYSESIIIDGCVRRAVMEHATVWHSDVRYCSDAIEHYQVHSELPSPCQSCSARLYLQPYAVLYPERFDTGIVQMLLGEL